MKSPFPASRMVRPLVLPTLISLPVTEIEPLFAFSELVSIVAPLVPSTSMRPPSLALREDPPLIVVTLEVAVAAAAVPLKTPPITIRWAGAVAGVVAKGAVALIVVAPRTLVTPWAVAGCTAPEKIRMVLFSPPFRLMAGDEPLPPSKRVRLEVLMGSTSSLIGAPFPASRMVRPVSLPTAISPP